MVKLSSNYLTVNKEAFDRLASEYNKRSTGNIKHQEAFLRPFEKRLNKEFDKPIRVLDAGCGVGIDSLILSIHGFKVHAIDFSRNMLSFARQNSPFATFEQVNFLDTNSKTFNGILMDAFIHLFPQEDTPLVLQKTKSLLVPRGLVLVSTTYSKKAKEGFFVKQDYGKKMKRFRRFWTKEQLINEFEDQGFKLMNYFVDRQERWDKEWMNFIFQLKDPSIKK